MQISKTFSFEASHVLPDHPGKCGFLHGHSYKVRIAIKGSVGENGFVMDYGTLSALIQPYIDALDHTHLNYVLRNPTAEIIAAFFGFVAWNSLSIFKEHSCQNIVVTVQETAKTDAVWMRTNKADWFLSMGVYNSVTEDLDNYENNGGWLFCTGREKLHVDREFFIARFSALKNLLAAFERS